MVGTNRASCKVAKRWLLTMSRDQIRLKCYEVMGVPSTRATCSACDKQQEFFGVRTYRRAEEWAQAHVCGVVVAVPRAGFEFPKEATDE